MVYFVCAGHICSGLSQSEFYLHVLMTAMHTGTGPASAAPSTQRISGQETLTAGCVGRAVDHGYGSHAFRCPHIEDSLQEQRNSQPDECLTDLSGFRAQVFKSVRRTVVLYTSLPAPAWRLVLSQKHLNVNRMLCLLISQWIVQFTLEVERTTLWTVWGWAKTWISSMTQGPWSSKTTLWRNPDSWTVERSDKSF